MAATKDVAQLVSHHALDFRIVHELQYARGECHRGVRRVAASGKSVW